LIDLRELIRLLSVYGSFAGADGDDITEGADEGFVMSVAEGAGADEEVTTAAMVSVA
jgi:hypothetical protein